MSRRTLIKGACLITMDPALGTIPHGDILVEGDTIGAIGVDLDAGEAEVIDAKGMIAIPGLVDTHRHLWMTPLRGSGADLTYVSYVGDVLLGIRSAYRPNDVYNAVYAGALDALDAGVTTVVNFADCVLSPDHIDQEVRALQESGLRCTVCYGRLGSPEVRKGVTPNFDDFSPPEWQLADMQRIRKNTLASDDALVTMGMACTELDVPSLSGCDPIELALREYAFGRSLGLRTITMHVAMGAFSSETSFIEAASKAGLLGPDLLYVHANGLSDNELRLVAASGAAISTTPYGEMAEGTFPIAGRSLDHDIRTALGIDTVIAIPSDFFTHMRMSLQIERGLRSRALVAKGQAAAENTMPARTALELATIRGADAIGLGPRIGSLTPGKQADIVLLRTDRYGIRPIQKDVIYTVVTQIGRADVDTVFVGGRTVKRNGQLTTVDAESVFHKLDETRAHLLATAESRDLATLRQLAAKAAGAATL